MSASLAAAEKAALEGAGQEWDTQMCMAAQDEILSSPARTPGRHDPVASSTNLLDSLTNIPLPPAPFEDEVESQVEPEIVFDFLGIGEHSRNETYESAEPPSNANLAKSTENANPAPATVHFKRDAAGKLRPYTATGEESLPVGFQQKYYEVHKAVMEDLTQKSSMSLTQENSESVYEQFNRGKIQEDYPSTATPDDGLLPTQANPDSLHSRYASARTESTAVTYQEDDPRHIRVEFDLGPAQESDDDDDEVEESQDASYTIPRPEMANHSYDPQTPAPPINPFTTKGSVMKGYELFGATQPSSIGRRLETPGSARPSPDVYNDFSSPPKRRRVMSSPLNFTGVEAETSPLQSSVRLMLAQSMSMDSPLALVPRTSGVQSFDVGPRDPVYEPRAYVSMKESQERRNKRNSSPLNSDSDSDDFESDIPAVPRHRRIDPALRKELSSVELRKKVTSSRTSSAPTPAVEVPSTRPGALDDEHMTQCEGLNARDTHQTEETQSQDDVMDDIIVDSQALPPLPQVSSAPVGSQLATHLEVDSPVNSQPVYDNAIMTSIPLQQLSPDRQQLRTPTARKSVEPDVDTVPETSPPNDQTTPSSPVIPSSPAEEHLRPMGEIASISFGDGMEQDLMDGISGLTQDVGFENARNWQGSSPMPPRLRSFRKEISTEALDRVMVSRLGDDTPKLLASKPVQRELGAQNVEEVQALSDDREMKLLTSMPHTANMPVEADSPVSSILSELPSGELSPPQWTNPINIEGTADRGESMTINDEIPEAIGLVVGSDSQPENVSGKEPSPFNNFKGVVKDIGDSHLADEKSISEIASSNADDENVLPKHKTPLPNTKVSDVSGSLKTKTSRTIKAPTATPRQSSRVTKKPSKSTLNRVTGAVTASITPRSSPLRSVVTPDTIDNKGTSSKRTSKRRSGVVPAQEDPVAPTRSSKRQSTARESSEDPLALTSCSTALFANMAFAIGYVDPDRDRDRITQLIIENSGTILQDGFDKLFEASRGEDDTELRLSNASKQLGFTALIADEHSRKAKYMQALALGLPCISGHWISACVSKGRVVEWAPYLLCAGMSSVLDAAKSRMLSPYPAATARLEDVISSRDQLLNGKSVLFVAGKSKSEIDKRKAYTFLTQVLGPARLTRVGDLHEARKKLSEADSDGQWDMLYVDVNEQQAEKTVFGPALAKSSKRKRVSDDTDLTSSAPPKKIRVIADETMVQSLIMGQLLEN